MKYFQLALINDLTFQRENTPTPLSRKSDELKMIFGFQKKVWHNVLHCISEAHTGAGARVFDCR